jgi:23S rRNA (guanosine2251-2'-O)-methyltransferase
VSPRPRAATARRSPAGRAMVRRPQHDRLGADHVEGRRAVLELLAAGRRRVRRVLVAEGQEPSPLLDQIERLAARSRVPLETVPRARLVAQAKTASPQGVLAMAEPCRPVPLAELATEQAFLLVVAGVTDPQNLGSMLRSAAGAGVRGVVLQKHRAAHLTPSAVKVAAGAVEHLDFCLVGGIASALTELASAGLRTVGLAAEATQSLYRLDLAEGGLALVVGGEERGLSPLVRRRCEVVAAIPQHGGVPSLNVAAAATVACFEAARQRAGGLP